MLNLLGSPFLGTSFLGINGSLVSQFLVFCYYCGWWFFQFYVPVLDVSAFWIDILQLFSGYCLPVFL